MPFTWPARLPKVLRLPLQDRERPGRLGGDVDQVAELDLRRHRHAVLDVAMALAEHLQIDGEHQRAAFRGRGALDQGADEAAVADHIELEPERLRRPPAATSSIEQIDIVDSVNGMPAACAARQARISPSPCCMPHSPIGASASGSDTFSPRMVVERSRCDDVDQHALAQLDALQVVAVGAQRLLRIGAGIGIVEERARHLAAGGAGAESSMQVMMRMVLVRGLGQHPIAATRRMRLPVGRRRSPQTELDRGAARQSGQERILGHGNSERNRRGERDRREATAGREHEAEAPADASSRSRWRRGWRRAFRPPIRSMSPSRPRASADKETKAIMLECLRAAMRR